MPVKKPGFCNGCIRLIRAVPQYNYLSIAHPFLETTHNLAGFAALKAMTHQPCWSYPLAQQACIMSRKKRTSRMLENAELRSAGLKAVDPRMDFGDVRTLAHLTAQMEQLRTKLDAYNTALAIIDSSKSELDTLEKLLGDLADQMLIGVAFKYGKNSREYEMAGGVRKSERIRRSTVSRLKAGADGQASSSSTGQAV